MKLLNTGNLYATEFIEHNRWDNEIWANNLFINGSLEFENTFNYSGDAIYVDSTSGNYISTPLSKFKTIETTELIEVNDTDKYISEIYVKNGLEISRLYLGVHCFTKDLETIMAANVFHFTDTQTYLAEDLNNDDNTIYLVDASNWRNPPVDVTSRRISIYNNSYYPDYTFAPIVQQYDTADDINHTIALPVNWGRGFIPAGTAVANASAGFSYLYRFALNVLTTDEWTFYGGPDRFLQGMAANGLTSNFFYGTKYIKYQMLTNRDTTNNTLTFFKGMKFWNATSNQMIYTSFDNVRIESGNIIKSREFNEIDLTSENPIMRITNDYQIQTKGEISEVV